MGLLEIYKVYQNSKGFEKELYGSLYRVLGGKKKVDYASKETEWYLRFLYYFYRARKSFVNEEKNYYAKLKKLKNKAQGAPLYFADIKREEYEFANLTLNYFKKEVIERSTNELRAYGIKTRLTTNPYENPGFLIITLLDSEGYSFNTKDFYFTDSHYPVFITNFFTECYILLKDSRITMCKVQKSDVKMITSYIGQINKIFDSRNIRGL